MTLEIIPAHADHIPDIAARMRAADVAEVMASSGSTPEDALSYSLAHSSMAWTVCVDGRPEIMFGAADLNILTATGAPWMLGTDAIFDISCGLFRRQSLHWKTQLLTRYAVLTNYVDDRNTASKRWLTWMGFVFSEPIPAGVNGEMFRAFELRR